MNDCHFVAAYGIPIKTTGKVLQMILEIYCIWNKMDQIKVRQVVQQIWLHWYNETKCLSRCIYQSYSFSIKTIKKLNFDNIWKRKTWYLRKTTMVKDYEDGGLPAIDFDYINSTLKRIFLHSKEQQQQHIMFPKLKNWWYWFSFTL